MIFFEIKGLNDRSSLLLLFVNEFLFGRFRNIKRKRERLTAFIFEFLHNCSLNYFVSLPLFLMNFGYRYGNYKTTKNRSIVGKRT